MSERPKEHASKACVGASQPWVQIPPPPPGQPATAATPSGGPVRGVPPGGVAALRAGLWQQRTTSVPTLMAGAGDRRRDACEFSADGVRDRGEHRRHLVERVRVEQRALTGRPGRVVDGDPERSCCLHGRCRSAATRASGRRRATCRRGRVLPGSGTLPRRTGGPRSRCRRCATSRGSGRSTAHGRRRVGGVGGRRCGHLDLRLAGVGALRADCEDHGCPLPCEHVCRHRHSLGHSRCVPDARRAHTPARVLGDAAFVPCFQPLVWGGGVSVLRRHEG